MTAGEVRWTCGRCHVSVGRIDAAPTELPETWDQTEGLTYCLSCSRARAGEAAIELAPETTSREDLVRIRRTALIEFEIGRAPEATDRVIAQACRTSGGAVAAVRTGLTDRSLDTAGSRQGA
jgi:hypothetical protein